jgi:hypothetical protein
MMLNMSLVGAQGKKIAEKEEERGDQGKRDCLFG